MVAEDFLATLDEAHLLVVLVLEFLVLQTCELGQAHVDDGAGLQIAELVLVHESLTGLVGSLAGSDKGHNLIDDVDGAQQTFQDVGAAHGLVHLELRAARHHLFAVLHEVLDELLEVQQLRTSMHQGDVVHRETALQLGELEQLVQNHVGHHIVTQHVDDADAVLVALVADVCDTLDLAGLHQLGGLLNHLGLVHTVGDGRSHNHVAAFGILLNLGDGTDDDAATSSGIGFADAVVSVDDAAQRKVGGFDVLHQLLYRNLRFPLPSLSVQLSSLDIGHAALQHLAEVVGGHIGGHTDGDAVGAVDKQVGQLGGQHTGFLALVVVGGHHIDGVLVDIRHQLVAYLLQTGLGVTHGCRRVAVDGAEVTLTVHQRIAHRPVLSQAHQSTIDTRVAVGVVLTHHVAHDAGALLRRSVVKDTVLVHRVQNAAVHRLETVAHIGQSPSHNHRHRIVDIGSLHRLLNIHSLDSFVFNSHR